MSKATDQAYHHIRSDILAGTLAPGEQLREESLALACGVSRTPVREALRRLEAEHLVRRTDSSRTFVAEWSLDDVEEGFVLRAMLEGHAAARATSRIDEGAIDRLAACNAALLRAARSRTPDVPGFIEHNRMFHGILLHAAQSDRLAGLLGVIVEQPIVHRTARHYDPEQMLQSHREHEELLLAFRRRDPEWARAVMTAHIRRAFHTYRDAFSAQQGLEADDAPMLRAAANQP